MVPHFMFVEESVSRLRNAELFQSGDQVFSGRAGAYVRVEVEDAAVPPDDEGVPGREETYTEHAVRSRGGLARVAQHRVVQLERLGELSVPLGPVDAGGEIGRVEGPDPFAVLTERPALRRSSSRECLGEPRQYDRPLPDMILQTVVSPVGPDEVEGWRDITDLKLGHARFYPQKQSKRRLGVGAAHVGH
jgi:hypothetical protein